MAFPDLTATPAYQDTCRTLPVMGAAPASSRRDPRYLHSYQLRDAGSRLDHLVRRALNPDVFPDWPPLYLLSAIKAFVETIEEHSPRMHFPDDAGMRAYIDPRLALAREILRRCDERLVECGDHPVTSAGFRQHVAQFESQFRFPFTDIVFENPLCMIEQAYGPFSRTQRQERFHTAMLVYWN